jgi:uncharacterized cupin superfamily protein
VRRVNLLAPDLDQSSERDGYRWRGAEIGGAVGAEEIAGRLYELGAGQRNAPYHFHHGIEEWLVVVDGTPTVRSPDGERTLQRGDTLCFPAGPAGAHQVTGAGTILILSTRRIPDAIEYPDSGKLELRPSGKVYLAADSVDCSDGE